ncbi:MAG TPA: hypothetical protein VFD07_13140 [Candidatus Krumholzibacteria bacterium]|nr:hypothetical protein [Candidatus Krumholzibacteria bacterium]
MKRLAHFRHADPGVMRHPWGFGACGVGALAAYVGMILASPWDEHFGAFLACYAVAFAACWGVSRTRAGLVGIILAAGVYRAVLLPLPPMLSDDIYRYVWEGRVQSTGANPYLQPPVDPGLEKLRDTDWERVNHPEATAIYPPLAQLFFRGLAALGGVFVFKAAFVAIDLVLILLLAAAMKARRVSASRLALYAWNPLVIVEVAGSGHLEPLAILPMVAAVLWVERRPLGAWSALAVSVAMKYAGVLAAPLLWRARRPRLWHVLAFVTLVMVFTLPYLGAGKQLFASLELYATKWRFNDLLFAPLAALSGSLGVAKSIATLFLLAVLVALLLFRVALERSTQLLFCSALLLSPTIHPWYLLWAVALLPLAPSPFLFVWSGSVILAYLHLFPLGNFGPLAPSHWLPRVLEIAPLLVVCMWLLRNGNRPFRRGRA